MVGCDGQWSRDRSRDACRGGRYAQGRRSISCRPPSEKCEPVARSTAGSAGPPHVRVSPGNGSGKLIEQTASFAEISCVKSFGQTCALPFKEFSRFGTAEMGRQHLCLA